MRTFTNLKREKEMLGRERGSINKTEEDKINCSKIVTLYNCYYNLSLTLKKGPGKQSYKHVARTKNLDTTS